MNLNEDDIFEQLKYEQIIVEILKHGSLVIIYSKSCNNYVVINASTHIIFNFSVI